MKKLLLTATLALLGGAASAAPGFVKAIFSGSAYNGTSDIWSYTKATVVENLDEIYAVRSDHPTTTTYAYGTYMQLEGGVEYYFAGQYDDYVTVKIDDAIVIPQGGNFGIVKFGETGWHKVELRFANNGGPGGVTSASLTYGGAWFKKGAMGTYQKFVNNDAGTLYVTEAPDGYAATTPEYAFRYSTYNSGGTTYTQLIKCGGCVENIAIPDQIDGYPVGQINDSCFNGNTMLKTITHWPSQLTTIGGSAFYGCTALELVEVPDTVTSLGGSAFRCCSALKTAKLPKDYTRTADALFMDCTALASVTMPDAPTRIDDHTFRNCNVLTSVAIPETVAYIGGMAFYECNALPDVTIPDAVYSIGSQSFYGCSSFTRIVVPDNVQTLGTGAFQKCPNVETATLPVGLEAIPNDLFRWDYKLKSVNVPATLTSIGSYAFNDCYVLEEFALPAGLKTLGEGAFHDCYALRTDVVIPNGVTVLNGVTFYMCKSLTSVTIPNTVTSIGGQCFQGCEKLTKIVVPDSVTSLGGSTFASCTKLTDVTLSANITSIPGGCFSGCTSLPKIHLPDKITTIGNDAFNGCTALAEINFPDSLKGIYWHAFVNCTSLRSVEFPAGLEWFYNYDSSYEDGWGFHDWPVFNNCSGLQNVVFNGPPPKRVQWTQLLSHHCVFPKEYGSKWIQTIGINSFSGYSTGSILTMNVISSSIRENDPTIMDVVYKVTSKKPTVKVRVLAFEDGERSFAKVVRPETFVTDTNGVETACNVGDNVTPNVEHTISWRVSSDWTTKLAKVKFEVLACEGELLPLELMTIPASDQYGKMKISWNAISDSQWLDAMFWLYADKDSGLKLENGLLKDVATGDNLVNGTGLTTGDTGYYSYYNKNGNWVDYHYETRQTVPAYVFGKMGYSWMDATVMSYVNGETRLGLSKDGARQYAYKIVEE